MTAADAPSADERSATPLPAPDAAAAALIDALDRRVAGALVLSIAPADEAPAESWIALDAGGSALHVAPLLADGTLPVLRDGAGRPDAALAAVALAAVEPLVGAIETAVGRPLRPVAIGGEPGADDARLRVEGFAGGAVSHRLLLAVPRDLPVAPAAALLYDPAAAGAIAPGWTARIPGPAVAAERLAAIAPGDLLLLGVPTGLVRFRPPGRDVVLAGRLMTGEAKIRVEQEALASEMDAEQGAEEGSVALTLEFDGGGVTLERAAMLGIGDTVALPASAGALAVRVMAEGRPVASGDLIAIGDGHGVLVTGVTAREG